jgi:hypothetical protein
MVLIAAAIVMAPAQNAMAGSNKQQSSLTRVPGAPDSNAKGEVRVESEADRARYSIEVKAKQIDPSIEHRLYMADGVGALQFIGDLLPEHVDEVRYRARTEDGDALPFGVASPDALEGRPIEVRQVINAQEQLLLVGSMPGAGAQSQGSARSNLDPTELSPPRSKARVRLRSRPSRGDERIEVKANKLDFTSGQEYRVFLEDPATGFLEDVGALERKKKSSSARFRRRTKDGDALPFGVISVAELTNLALEIVDMSTDQVYFEGVTPGWN